jgi:hypothetical protein
MILRFQHVNSRAGRAPSQSSSIVGPGYLAPGLCLGMAGAAYSSASSVRFLRRRAGPPPFWSINRIPERGKGDTRQGCKGLAAPSQPSVAAGKPASTPTEGQPGRGGIVASRPCLVCGRKTDRPASAVCTTAKSIVPSGFAVLAHETRSTGGLRIGIEALAIARGEHWAARAVSANDLKPTPALLENAEQVTGRARQPDYGGVVGSLLRRTGAG